MSSVKVPKAPSDLLTDDLDRILREVTEGVVQRARAEHYRMCKQHVKHLERCRCVPALPRPDRTKTLTARKIVRSGGRVRRDEREAVRESIEDATPVGVVLDMKKVKIFLIYFSQDFEFPNRICEKDLFAEICELMNAVPYCLIYGRE